MGWVQNLTCWNLLEPVGTLRTLSNHALENL
jgi:hypothetical protein